MSKREDAHYLKTLARVHKSEIHHWAEIPLVVMDQDSALALRAMDKAGEVLEQLLHHKNKAPMMQAFHSLDIIPLKEFMFLNKTVAVNNPVDVGAMEFNYYHVSNISSETMLIQYPTMHDGMSIVEVRPQLDKPEYPGINFRSIFDGKTIDYTESHDTQKQKVKHFLSAMMITVLTFFDEIDKAGLYAVEAKHTGKHRKHNAKRPWQRKDQSTIQFLNQMPQAHNAEAQGGHHQSPRYHRRRATTRKLTHPRFKNHPKYGQEIAVKASWVGNKEETVNGITYKVLE